MICSVGVEGKWLTTEASRPDNSPHLLYEGPNETDNETQLTVTWEMTPEPLSVNTVFKVFYESDLLVKNFNAWVKGCKLFMR